MRLGRIREASRGGQYAFEVFESDVRQHRVRMIPRWPNMRCHAAPLHCAMLRSILALMTDNAPNSAIDLEIKRLEKRLEELVATVNQIKEENRALRQRQDALTSERAGLLQKNEQVRARVEAMIGRLKSMEQA